MVSAGYLDQRVTFQAQNLSPDGTGGFTEAWADFGDTPTVWAHVKPLRGREVIQEGSDAAVAEYRFIVRYRADVVEADRIVWNGSAYNIRQVMRTSGRELFLQIIAERGVPT